MDISWDTPFREEHHGIFFNRPVTKPWYGLQPIFIMMSGLITIRCNDHAIKTISDLSGSYAEHREKRQPFIAK